MARFHLYFAFVIHPESLVVVSRVVWLSVIKGTIYCGSNRIKLIVLFVCEEKKIKDCTSYDCYDALFVLFFSGERERLTSLLLYLIAFI